MQQDNISSTPIPALGAPNAGQTGDAPFATPAEVADYDAWMGELPDEAFAVLGECQHGIPLNWTCRSCSRACLRGR